MTYRLLLLVMLTTMTAWGNVEAKNRVVPKMYMFGFAASFNDTIAYFTDVQEVDSVWMNKSNGFLLGREFYSQQLRDYLRDQHQLRNRTCVVMFSKSRTKAEKQLVKFRKKYTTSKDGKQHFDVRYLNDSDFRFKAIESSVLFDDSNEGTPTKKKKRKR